MAGQWTSRREHSYAQERFSGLTKAHPRRTLGSTRERLLFLKPTTQALLLAYKLSGQPSLLARVSSGALTSPTAF